MQIQSVPTSMRVFYKVMMPTEKMDKMDRSVSSA